jgi:hypothetical protein
MNGIFGYYYTYSYNLENNGIVNEIEETLNGKLIYFFKNIPECNSNEEKLILDKFDSIPEFCNCLGAFMKTEKCGKNTDVCKTIDTIPSNNYTMINSEHICVKKSDKRYIDFLKNDDIISKDKECPENYKLCGIIDTLGRKLCVENDNDCPIKKADIENNNDNSNQILSLFRLRPNYPCLNPIEKNWVYHEDLWFLSYNCTKEDHRYEQINGYDTNLFDLYKENNILNILPGYDENILKTEKIYLYARNFLGIRKEKATQFSKEEILYSQKLVNNCNRAMELSTYILILPIIISAGSFTRNGILALFLTAIYSIPLSIIYFILSIIIFVKNNTITSMLDIGSDEYISSAIKDLLSGNSINFYIPLISIIIFPIILILGFICLYIFVLRKKN